MNTPPVTKNQSLTEILNDIETRANAATPGPWDVVRYTNYEGYAISAKDVGCIAERWWPTIGSTIPIREIADFIASARTDVPKLVKALRELWEDYKNACGNFSPPVFETRIYDANKKLAAILTSPENGEQQSQSLGESGAV